jgi:hypothetical protein
MANVDADSGESYRMPDSSVPGAVPDDSTMTG